MQINSIQAIVLAAGKSTRFNTGTTKLLTPLCGRPMLLYITQLLEQLHIPMTVVIGYAGTEIRNAIQQKHTSASFVEQQEQLGTGHALAQTRKQWLAQQILVLNGDAPLITPESINALIEKHFQTNAAISFITAHTADPENPYGRVVLQNNQIRIIEAKDFTHATHEPCCINAGIYLMQKSFLESHIDELSNCNAAKEYYITDLINIAQKHTYTVEMVPVPFDQIRGINTIKELWTAEHIKRSELIAYWMNKGVRFSFAQSTHVDVDVTIGAGSFIGAGVHLMRGTKIGNNCIIHAFSIIENTQIADNVIVKPHSVISDAVIDSHVQVGPFAHIHQQSTVETQAVVGNFVELTRTRIGVATKAKHLSYLGDSTIGNHTNIGAGTITCNYNGVCKNQTTIHDHAFIGSNNTLVAPVTIGAHAYTAAGSVITQSVPDNSLAIARSRQTNKEEYATELKKRLHNNNQPKTHTTDAEQITPYLNAMPNPENV